MSQYEDDLKIDKYHLDNEVIKQPILYMQYQEEMVENQKLRDDLKLKIDVKKNNLKEVESELFIKYKSEKINDKIPTDSHVNAMIMIDKKRKIAFNDLISVQQAFNKAVYEYSLLESAVKSFEQRKKSLEKLVELYLSGYFSEVRQKKAKDNSENIRKRLNRKERNDED